MLFDELEYEIQDAFISIDEDIRRANQWWAEYGPAWLAWMGGGSHNFPIPPITYEIYQAFCGANPQANIQSLLETAEYWREQAEAASETVEAFVAKSRQISELLDGSVAPATFHHQAAQIADALLGLVQTQASLAYGTSQFAIETISAKAAYYAQVCLMLAEAVTALIGIFFTFGGSFVAFLASAWNWVARIWNATKSFLARISGVSFKQALKEIPVPRVPSLALPSLRTPSLSTMGKGVVSGLEALPTLAVHGFRPSVVAGRRAAGQIQRSLIHQAKRQGRPPQEIMRLRSREVNRTLARAVTSQLQGRGDDLLRAGRLTDGERALVTNAAREAVADGLTTWGVLREGLVGYGVRSAITYGGGGWVLQESFAQLMVHHTGVNHQISEISKLHPSALEGYRLRMSGLGAAVVGAGLGGAPLAFGARLPQMAFYGGVGGALGFYGAQFAEVALDPNLTFAKDFLAGEGFSGLLRAGGADNLLKAIAQGALSGGVWERFIGSRDLDYLLASTSDFGYAAKNVTGSLDLSGLVKEISAAESLVVASTPATATGLSAAASSATGSTAATATAASRTESSTQPASTEDGSHEEQKPTTVRGAPRIGEVHASVIHRHAVPERPDLTSAELSDDQRRQLTQSLRKQAEELEKVGTREEPSPVRRLTQRVVDPLPLPPKQTNDPVSSWPDQKFDEAIDAVLRQAAEDPSAASWKPAGDGWMVQGRHDGQSFVLSLDREGNIADARLGSFAHTTNHSPLASAAPTHMAEASAPKAISAVLNELVGELHDRADPRLVGWSASIDQESKVVAITTPDGSTFDVEFAVDNSLPEGHWYTHGGEYEFTPAGWKQDRPVTIVVSGEVRSDLAESAGDLARQVIHALAETGQDLPGLVRPRFVAQDVGRFDGSGEALPVTWWRSLPRATQVLDAPATEPVPSAAEAEQLVTETIARMQAGERLLDETVGDEDAPPASDTVVAVAGDPASGVKLAQYADGTTVAFAIEVADLPAGEALVVPGEWHFDGQQWRQRTATRIQVSDALVGDPEARRAQLVKQLAAALTEQYRTLPESDVPHQTYNARALLTYVASQGKTVPIDPARMSESAKSADSGVRLPVGQPVPANLDGSRVMVQFRFAKDIDRPQLILPQLTYVEGQIWQTSQAEVVLSAEATNPTWGHPQVRAALEQLTESLSAVGPVDSDALQAQQLPQNQHLSQHLQDITIEGEQVRLLPDPLPASASVGVGTPAVAGPDPHPRYLLRIPAAVGIADGARTVMAELAVKGYQIVSVTDRWATADEPGLVLTVHEPASAEGVPGRQVELRLLGPEAFVARQQVAREMAAETLSAQEVRRRLDVYGGRQRPIGLAELTVPAGQQLLPSAPPQPDDVTAPRETAEGRTYASALNLDRLVARYDERGIAVTEWLPADLDRTATVLLVSDLAESEVERYTRFAEEVVVVADRLAERGLGRQTEEVVRHAREWAVKVRSAGQAYRSDRSDASVQQEWQQTIREAAAVIDGLQKEERRFASVAETRLASELLTPPRVPSEAELVQHAQQLADALGTTVDLSLTDLSGTASVRTFEPAADVAEAAGVTGTAEAAPITVKVKVPADAGTVRGQPDRVEALLAEQFSRLAGTGKVPGLLRAELLPDGLVQLHYQDRTVTAQVRVRTDLPAGEATVRPGLIEISGQLPVGAKGSLVNAVLLHRAIAEYGTVAQPGTVASPLSLDSLLPGATTRVGPIQQLADTLAQQTAEISGPLWLRSDDPGARQTEFLDQFIAAMDELVITSYRVESDERLPATSRGSIVDWRREAVQLREEAVRRRELVGKLRKSQREVTRAGRPHQQRAGSQQRRMLSAARNRLARIRAQWRQALESNQELLEKARGVATEMGRLSGQEQVRTFERLVPPPVHPHPDPVQTGQELARELRRGIVLEVWSGDGHTTYEITRNGALIGVSRQPAAPSVGERTDAVDLAELAEGDAAPDVPALVTTLRERFTGVGPDDVVRLTVDPLALPLQQAADLVDTLDQLAEDSWALLSRASAQREGTPQFDQIMEALAQVGDVFAQVHRIRGDLEQLQTAHRELADLRRAAAANAHVTADLRKDLQRSRDRAELAVARWRADQPILRAMVGQARELERFIRDDLGGDLATVGNVNQLPPVLGRAEALRIGEELARQLATRVEVVVTESDGSEHVYGFQPDGTAALPIQAVALGGEGSSVRQFDPASDPATASANGPASSGNELPEGVTSHTGYLMGVAMEELPYLKELAGHLNQQFHALGVDDEVTSLDLDRLLQERFRNALSAEGMVHTFGTRNRRQFQIKIELSEPRRVRSEVNPHEAIHANLGQGHKGRSGSQSRANAASGSLNAKLLEAMIGALGGVSPSVQKAFRAHLSQYFDSRQYIEVGGVADNKGPTVPTEVEVAYEVAPVDVGSAAEATPIRIDGESVKEPRTLRFGIPENLYQPLPESETLRLANPERSAAELPHRMVLELTGREAMVAEVARILEASGIPVTESIRRNLRDHFWALPADLSTGAKSLHGYEIPIVDDGKLVASLRHNLEVLRETAQPVGRPSDEYRLEQVGTIFQRSNGGADVGGGAVTTFGVESSGTAAASWGSDQERSSGFNAESTAIRVRVDKNRQYNQFYAFGDWMNPESAPGVRHQLEVFSAGKQPLGRAAVDGSMIALLRESDAYQYGLPVSRDAVSEGSELRAGLVKPAGSERLFPQHLRRSDGTGTGIGVGMARDFELWEPGKTPGASVAPNQSGALDDDGGAGRTPENILAEKIMTLLPPEFVTGEVAGVTPNPGYGRVRQAVRALDEQRRLVVRLLQMFNQQQLERQLTTAALQTRYDELAQNYLQVTLLVPKWSSVTSPVPLLEFVERKVRVSLTQHVDRAEFLGYTTDRDNTHLTIGREARGHAMGGAQSEGPTFNVWKLGLGLTRSTSASADVADAQHDVTLFEHSSTDVRDLTSEQERDQAIAVWDIPHTVSVAFVGRPDHDFTMDGRAKVSMPASFTHDGQTPVSVTGREVTGSDGTPVELFLYSSAAITSVNVSGVTREGQELLDEVTEGLLSHVVRQKAGRLSMSNPEGDLEHAVGAMVSVDQIMAEFPRSIIDDGTGRHTEAAGGLRSDQLFRTGIGTDVRYGFRVGNRLGNTELLGVLEGGIVTGQFTFRLASMFSSVTSSRNTTVSDAILDFLNVARNFGKSITQTTGRIFGTERIPLNFERRRYHFRTWMTTQLDATAVAVASRTGRKELPGNWVTWTMAESDAMDAYGRGLLKLPTQEVARSLQRWQEEELSLKRVTAARAVRRLIEETIDGSGESPHLDLIDHLLTHYTAEEQRRLPAHARLTDVLQEVARLIEQHPYDPSVSQDVELPAYMSQEDGFGLGFAGIEYMKLAAASVDGETVAVEQLSQQVRDLVDQLTAGGITGESGDVAAPVGNAPGLGPGIDGAVSEAGLRAAIDKLLDGPDWKVIATSEVPIRSPKFHRISRFPVTSERIELVARARRVGEITPTGVSEQVGTEQQQYSYREQGRTRARHAGTSLGGKPVAALTEHGPEVATGSGGNAAVSETWQRTTIRTQTNWSGATMAEVPIEIEFEIRRYPSQPRSWLIRRLAALGGAIDGRPQSRAMTLRFDMGMQVPKGLVRERIDPVAQATQEGQLEPDRPDLGDPGGGRWRDLRMIRRLPSRFGVDNVQAKPLRDATMKALVELLGPRKAEGLRMVVQQQLSADSIPSNLDRLASGYGYDALPGVHLPDDPTAQVDVNVSVQFSVEKQRELPEHFGTGIIHRYQWIEDLLAERTRPAPVGMSHGAGGESEPLSEWAGLPELTSDLVPEGGGGVSGGAQAGYSYGSPRGARFEKTSKETGPVVELQLRYSASVEAVLSYSDGQHVPAELSRVERSDVGRGYIQLRIYQRDLPELQRLLAEQQPWTLRETSELEQEGFSPEHVPQLLEVRQQRAPVLSLEQVLAHGFADGQHTDLSGPALHRALAKALTDAGEQPEFALQPGSLVKLTVAHVAYVRTLAEQMFSQLDALATLATDHVADQPHRGSQWTQLAEQAIAAAAAAEQIRAASDDLTHAQQHLTALERQLERIQDPQLVQQWNRQLQARWAAYEHWQAAVAQISNLRQWADEAYELAATLIDSNAMPASGQSWHRPVTELELVRLVRQAAAEALIEIDLQVDRPTGEQVRHQLAPDGAWYRQDRAQGLFEAIQSLTDPDAEAEPQVGPEGEQLLSLSLRDQAEQLRLDLDDLYDHASQRGVPLRQVVADARNPQAARAAWAGLDVDALYADYDRRVRAGEALDREEFLAESARKAQQTWQRTAPEFHQAIRDAGLSAGQLLQAVVGAVDLPRIHEKARAAEQDPAVAMQEAVAAAPELGRLPTTLTELGALFGVSPLPDQLGRFRATLEHAGLLRGPGRFVDPNQEPAGESRTPPTEAEAALLRNLAVELAVRHGLFDPVQRGRVLELDPDWLAAVVSHRPSYLDIAELVLEPPRLERLSADHRERLAATARQVVDRYYHGLPIDHARREESPLSQEDIDRIQSIVYRWGVPAAALYTSSLPGAMFVGPLLGRDLILDTADPNAPSPRQQRFLNTTGRSIGWVASGDDAFFDAFFQALPDAARDHLAHRFGITSVRELRLDLTRALQDELNEPGAGPLWQRADKLTSQAKRAAALQALTEGGLADSELHDLLPTLVAERYGLQVVVRPRSAEPEIATPRQVEPVATVQLLRTVTHYLPVSPASEWDTDSNRAQHQRFGFDEVGGHRLPNRSPAPLPLPQIRTWPGARLEQVAPVSSEEEAIVVVDESLADVAGPVVSITSDPVKAQLDEVAAVTRQVMVVATEARSVIRANLERAQAAGVSEQAREALRAGGTATWLAQDIVEATEALQKARTRLGQATAVLRAAAMDPTVSTERFAELFDRESAARRQAGIAAARWQQAMAEGDHLLAGVQAPVRFLREHLDHHMSMDHMPMDLAELPLPDPRRLGEPIVDPQRVAAAVARRQGRIVELELVDFDGGAVRQWFTPHGEPIAPSAMLVTAIEAHHTALRRWQAARERLTEFLTEQVLPRKRALGITPELERDRQRLAEWEKQLAADPASTTAWQELRTTLTQAQAYTEAVRHARREARFPAARRVLLEQHRIRDDEVLVGRPGDHHLPGRLDFVAANVLPDGEARLVVLEVAGGFGARTASGERLYRGSITYLRHQLAHDTRLRQRLREHPRLVEQLRHAAAQNRLVVEYQLVTPKPDGGVRLHSYDVSGLDRRQVANDLPEPAPTSRHEATSLDLAGMEVTAGQLSTDFAVAEPAASTPVVGKAPAPELVAAVDTFVQRLRDRGELSDFRLERTDQGLLLRVQWPDGEAQARLVSDGQMFGLRPEPDPAGYPVVGLRPLPDDPRQQLLLVGMDLRPALRQLRDRISGEA